MTSSMIDRRAVLGGAVVSIGLVASPALLRAQRPDLTPVRIANASGNINLVMQLLMQKQGYLEQLGLQPAVTTVADGAKIVGGLIGGDTDVSTMSGFGQVFPAIEKGGRLKIIGGAMLLPALAMFTSRANINSLKDLEGKVIGAGALGSLVHQLTVALLIKKGVDYKKVKFANIGSSGDVFRAVTVGTVDAGLGEVNFLEQLDKFKVRPIPEGNLSTELPEYTYQGAYATERAIETKRDLLVRTLAAYARLYRFVHDPSAKEAYFRARSELLKTATPEDNEIQWGYIQKLKPYAVNLGLSEQRLAYMQQLNVELGVQRSVLPFNKVADMSLAQDALRLVGGPI